MYSESSQIRSDGAAVALLVGAPLAIGLVLGWGRAGQLAPLLSHFGALGYWLGFAVGVWLLMEICSRLVAPLVRRVRPSVIAIAAIGAILATLVTRPFAVVYGNWVLDVLNVELPGAGRNLAAWPDSVRQVGLGIVYSAEWIGIWTAANAFFFHALRRRRFGIEPIAARQGSTQVVDSASPSNARPKPAFLLRAKKDLGDEVIALQAQDHYVRVYTTRDSELLLYRFSDAIREVGEDRGIRVHRSYWIATAAIQRVTHRGQRSSVELKSGLSIPVSRTFIEDLRRHTASARSASVSSGGASIGH
jgi:hypothetical protein